MLRPIEFYKPVSFENNLWVEVSKSISPVLGFGTSSRFQGLLHLTESLQGSEFATIDFCNTYNIL